MEKIDYRQIPQPSMSKLKSYRGNFRCECGDEVDKEFLSIHMNDCAKMKYGYGKLYNALDELVEDSPVAGTWNNVQAMIAFFRLKLNQIIEENMKPVNFDVEMDQEESLMNGYGGYYEDENAGMKCMK